MDSNKIRNLAYGARAALRAEVSARLDAVLAEGSGERLEHPDEVRRIVEEMKETGREKVVDKAAYTWFNRLCALRFMDANGYTTTPAVTPRPGSTQPAILADAAQGVFDREYGFGPAVRQRVSAQLIGAVPSANAQEEAYAALLVAVCEHYAKPMPYLFREDAASNLLMPQGLLSEGSILARIVQGMDPETCGSVEVLGWLYQYYIAERKDEVLASKKKRCGVEEIGPATQLFTPNWIVRYLAENSVGRLWMLNNPDSGLAGQMEYYIEPGGEAEEFIVLGGAEELTVCDPACGSGHILVYAFDLLYAMYEEEGWPAEDIPEKILRNNLFGFEIDRRAAEIASFALEMKARERDPLFFDKDVDARITVLEPVVFAEGELQGAGLICARNELLDAFAHLDEIGSLYVPDSSDLTLIDAAIDNLGNSEGLFSSHAVAQLSKMRRTVEALSRRYAAVVANPPWIGFKSINTPFFRWVETHYPIEKVDLCTCFVARAGLACLDGGYLGMITSSTWLSQKGFVDFRNDFIRRYALRSMVQLSTHGFPGVAATACAFACGIGIRDSGKATFIRLEDFDKPSLQQPYALEAIRNIDSYWRYEVDPREFLQVPDSPFSYWVSDGARKAFEKFDLMGKVGSSCQGCSTGDNGLFLRFWWEVNYSDLKTDAKSGKDTCLHKWFPHNKGGDYCRWYGNREWVINWHNNGEAICNFVDGKGKLRSAPRNSKYYFRSGATWSDLTVSLLSVRFAPPGCTFNSSGPTYFPDAESVEYVCGLMNTTAFQYLLTISCSGLHYNNGAMARMPFPICNREEVEQLARENISLTKRIYDEHETSFDFCVNPLIGKDGLIANAIKVRADRVNAMRQRLKNNEERLNIIAIEAYGLGDEVTYESAEEKLTIQTESPEAEVKNLISYAVGCMFGRYSLGRESLVIANQSEAISEKASSFEKHSYKPDDDGIIPILDGEWFGDDIVAAFYAWLASAFGEGNLDSNVAYIESVLGRDVRAYFVKDFYQEHCSMYAVQSGGRRPIYWMFQSPKKGFQCLIYLHRYNEGTVGEVLTKYLRPYQEKLRAQVAMLSRSDRARDVKEASKLQARVEELEAWERDVIYPLAHERVSIDLDDGVKVNYNKFPKALAKVQGLSEWK